MTLGAGEVVSGLIVAVDHESIVEEQRVAGTPTAGCVALGEFGETEVGIWEMTPGTATDVEVNEVFIVLAGHARVEFADRPAIEVGPGDIVRLEAGMATTWTVTQTLRKVYLA